MAISLTPHFLLLLICGAAAGGFINGLAGFGTALFALVFWLQIMTPIDAVSLAVTMSVISGIPGVWMLRRTIVSHQTRLTRFVVPALVGIPIGVACLSEISPALLKLVIAGFLILYGSFFIVRKNLPKIRRSTPKLDAAIGFTGGILGGSTGLSGVFPTMWCAMRPWPKEQTRAVTQPFNVLILFIAAMLFALKGAYHADALLRIAIVFPVTMLFAFLGMLIFRRLDDEYFRRLVIGLLFLTGLILSARELF